MIKFECPKCIKEVILIEHDSLRLKWLIICPHCLLYKWVDELKEIPHKP